MWFYPRSSAKDIRGGQKYKLSFIGNTDFQLRAITPLLITAQQLVFVFCNARRLAIMTFTQDPIFKKKILYTFYCF